MTGSKFVTLEGTEGVGKSTNVELVVDCIERAGHRVVVTREPGGTPLAEEIRALLLGVRDESMAPMTELLLIFAARAQHLEEVIKPALGSGCWVVCDRFTDATYAYQGGGRGLNDATISSLEQLVQQQLRPDLTLYLDVSVDIAVARIADREHDRFEREERQFFENVRTAYLRMAQDNPRYRIINAAVALEEVQQQVKRVIDGYLAAPD